MMGQSETLSQQLDHIYYTLFCRCTALLGLLPAKATCTIKQKTKPFSGAKPAKPANVGFSSSNFTVQDHVPSTIGDALRVETCYVVSMQLNTVCQWY